MCSSDLSNWNGPVEDIFDAAPAAQLVDALFGTGLTRGLDAPLASQLCSLVTEARYSFAVDMPSGVHTDSGECLSDVPQYDLCVTLGAAKPAHLLYPAAGRFRHLRIADIGIDTSSATAAILARPALSPPEAVSHKYSRGLVAIVSGAMPGAARLAAVAAARGGAGYVRLIGDQHPPLDAIVPASLESLDDQRVRAMLIGPGLGRDAAAKLLLARKLARSIPAVIDADALLLLDPDWRADMPVILTPHSGEFAILHPERQGSKIDQARAAAAKRNAVVIFKGADTVIAAPDGRVAITGRSSSWLSTAGTGDVLAGLCAARLAVSGDAFDAACEAVWLHGEAARRAGPAFAADDLTARIADAMGACL